MAMRRRLTELKKPSNIRTIVASHEETLVVPYHLQGDEGLHTDEMIEARLKLRHAPKVAEVLQVWWVTAQRSLQSAGDALADELPKDKYFLMSRKLYRALVPTWDEADFNATAEEEWLRDADGASTMGRKRFCDAIFEVRR